VSPNETDLSVCRLYQLLDKKPKIIFLTKWRSEVLQLLEEVEFSTDVRMIKYLLELVLSGDRDIAAAAFSNIRLSLQKISPLQWIFISENVRSGGDYDFPRNIWYSLKPQDLFKLGPPKHRLDFYGLLSLHPNGFVREQALKELDRFSSGEEICYLLLRLNDWVKQNSDRARMYLYKRIKPENIDWFISNLPLVYHLNACRREDHSLVVQSIEYLLKDCKEAKTSLLNMVSSKDKHTRRACYRLLTQLEQLPTDTIITLGLNHVDSIIQSQAVNYVLSKVDDQQGCKFYLMFKNAKRVGTRKHAPFLLEYCNNLNRLDELKKFLLDDSASIRDTARYLLKKSGINYFREVYLEALNAGNRNLYSAICGLGETGTREDADKIAVYLNTATTKTKKAILLVLAKLNCPKYSDVLLSYLDNNHVGISNTARKGLEKVVNYIDRDRLWDIVQRENCTIHVMENIILLFTKMSKWTALIQLLKLLGQNSESITDQINSKLKNWLISFNRSFIQPEQADLKSILYLVDRYHTKLNEAILIQLNALLKPYN
jgi:hypothetical protein